MLSNISGTEKIAPSDNHKTLPVLFDFESERIEDNEDETDFDLTFLHVLTLNSMLKGIDQSSSIEKQIFVLPIHINSCPIYIFSGRLVI